MAEYDKLFTRKATGLVRQIGISTAVIIAICNVVGLGWQKRVFQATGWSPLGEDKFFLGIHPMVMAFLVTGILIILSIYCFAVLSAAMPKSGGGYIFISRILSPKLGFVATWLQFWSVAVAYGMISVCVMEVIFRFGKMAGFDIGFMMKPWTLFLVSMGIMSLFSGLACFGIKQTGRLLHTIFWVPLGMMIVVYILFIIATPQEMALGVKNLFGGYSAGEYTKAALAQGMGEIASKNTYWGAVAVAMLGAYWAYIGYAAATFVAGEVKEAHKTLPKALFISGAVIIVIYISMSTLMARATQMIGKEGNYSFLSSVAYLNYGGGSFRPASADDAVKKLIEIGPPTIPYLEDVLKETQNVDMKNRLREILDKVGTVPATGKPKAEEAESEKIKMLIRESCRLPEVGGWMPVMAAIEASGIGLGSIFMFLLVIFAALWVANDIPPFILTSSRMIFAMSFDRVLPSKLSKVSERWHSPVNAIIFVSLVSLLGAAAEAEVFSKKEGALWLGNAVHSVISSKGLIAGSDIWDALFFTCVAIACIFFPLRKPGIFEKSPFRATKTFVIVVGAVAALGNVVLVGIIAINSHALNLFGIKSLSDATPFLFTVALVVSAILIYDFYSKRAKKTGVELTTIFTEIPPD